MIEPQLVFGFNLNFTAHERRIACALVSSYEEEGLRVISCTWFAVDSDVSQQIKQFIRLYSGYRVSIAYTVGPHKPTRDAQLLLAGVLRGIAVADGIDVVYVKPMDVDIDHTVRLPEFLHVLTDLDWSMSARSIRIAIQTAIQGMGREVEA